MSCSVFVCDRFAGFHEVEVSEGFGKFEVIVRPFLERREFQVFLLPRHDRYFETPEMRQEFLRAIDAEIDEQMPQKMAMRGPGFGPDFLMT